MCLAVPGQVESIRDANGIRMGRVNFGGVVKDVCLAYLPDIAVGDYTIVHVGFAITKIDEAAAQETLRTFTELGILEEGLAELRDTDADSPGAVKASPSETRIRQLGSPSTDPRLMESPGAVKASPSETRIRQLGSPSTDPRLMESP